MTWWGSARKPADGHDERRAADEERVIALVKAHAPDVLAYLERRSSTVEDAADVLAETLTTTWRRVADLPDDNTRARMWLFATARRTLANHRRGRRRADELTVKLRTEMQAGRPESAVGTTDPATEAIRRAIDRLPPAQREVVTLVHWDGFTLTEVADITGTPASTVRSQYASAKQNLHRHMQEDTGRPRSVAK